MSVVVVGIEHQQVSLDLLERVSVGERDLPKLLGTLRDIQNVQEAVVLSTCLRFEVYAVVDRFHEAVDQVQELLSAKSGLPQAELESRVSIRFDDDVAVHLFAVASGLESAVPGESEVLGQVRRAWQRAQEERISGPVLSELFRHAVETGKRVRSETGIARGTTSFSHAAVELAEATAPRGLAATTAVVIGAGEIGAGVTDALAGLPAERRPAEIVVVNRTPTRAEELVRRVAGAEPGLVRAAPMGELPALLPRADVVLSAVEAEGHVVEVSALCPEGSRAEWPVLVVDLGVPRNVDPAAGAVAGVSVLDMDHLSSAVARAMEERRGEAERARVIVEEEVHRHRLVARARGAAPVIASLRARLEDLRQSELGRRRARQNGLSDEQWEQVDAVTRSVLAKLLHEPTTVLKDTAGTTRGERLV